MFKNYENLFKFFFQKKGEGKIFKKKLRDAANGHYYANIRKMIFRLTNVDLSCPQIYL